MDDEPGDEGFGADWAARGISESTLRRHTAPLARPPAGLPRNALGSPAGPRDWTPPPEVGRTRVRTGRRTHPARHWLGACAVLVAAVALVVSLVHSHGNSGGPAVAQTVGPARSTGAAGSAIPPVSATASPTQSDAGPAVSNISEVTTLGSCFDLPAGTTRITARFHPCSHAHHFQLIAFERASGTDDRYPDPAYWDGPVQARCTTDLVRYTGQPEQNWPPTLSASVLLPRRAGWALGDRAVYCLGEYSVARTGTMRHLAAFHRPSAIASTQDDPATASTLTGRLAVGSLGDAVCLTVRGPDGSPVPVRPADRHYSWLAATNADGSADNARSGIASGSQPDVTRIVRHAGSRVTLIGRYASPDTLGCGGDQEFDFTAVR